MRREHTVAQEPDSLDYGEDGGFLGVQFQSKPSHELGDLAPQIVQFRLVVREDEEIVDVPNVSSNSQPVFYEVVERIEIDVAKELARLISDRNAPSPLDLCEQVVAGKPSAHRFLQVAAVDDSSDQPQHVMVLDFACHQVLQYLVIKSYIFVITISSFCCLVPQLGADVNFFPEPPAAANSGKGVSQS
jgi:hypothetical protein